jgi:hypothetical protein
MEQKYSEERAKCLPLSSTRHSVDIGEVVWHQSITRRVSAPEHILS